MRIALDAMGTDRAPATEVLGALSALRELEDDIELVLVGDQSSISDELARHSQEASTSRLQIHHAPDRVPQGEPSAAVVRRRPDSSIVVGLQLLRAGEVDAFVSAGSTGAVMAASFFVLGTLEGVDRPTIGTPIPTKGRHVLLLDSGANVDCKPIHLNQFAHLGSIFAQDLMGVERPRVGLLNIGSEPEKGNELAQEAYQLLSSNTKINFVGNVEGPEIIAGACDVLVADGFVGNVLLKLYESVAAFIIGLVREAMADVETPPDLERILRVMDYSETGGAPLLGVNGVSIICHGGSSPKAIQNGIRVAAQVVRADMVAHMVRDLAELKRLRESA